MKQQMKKMMVLLMVMGFCFVMTACGKTEKVIPTYLNMVEGVIGADAKPQKEIVSEIETAEIEAVKESEPPASESGYNIFTDVAETVVDDAVWKNTTTKSIITDDGTNGEDSIYCVGIAKEIFDATNIEREKVGLQPLLWSDELAQAAQIRADEICTTFSHTRPDGSNCKTVNSLVTGENIARGPGGDGQLIVDKWMASEGHKANILWTNHRIIGIATVSTSQGITACQLFGY